MENICISPFCNANTDERDLCGQCFDVISTVKKMCKIKKCGNLEFKGGYCVPCLIVSKKCPKCLSTIKNGSMFCRTDCRINFKYEIPLSKDDCIKIIRKLMKKKRRVTLALNLLKESFTEEYPKQC